MSVAPSGGAMWREGTREGGTRRLAGAAAAFAWLVGGGAAPGMSGEVPWVAPPEQKARVNPVARAAGVRNGRNVFQVNCVPCHGPQGKGDGPAAAALNLRPRNLTERAVQEQTDGELFWKISTGRGPMPTWQHLPDGDRWGLVHYIRTMAPKK